MPKTLLASFHIAGGRNCHYCLVGKVMWQQIAHVLLLLNTYPLRTQCGKMKNLLSLKKIFRQIKSLLISMLELLLSQIFGKTKNVSKFP